MNDTIYRQAAIDAVRSYMEDNEVEDGDWHASGIAYEIKRLPVAQPEIIRCNDCKWWSNDDYRECSSPNYDGGYVTPAGFYCGWAKRRTDETN